MSEEQETNAQAAQQQPAADAPGDSQADPFEAAEKAGTAEASATTPAKDARPSSGGRKSLEGLSPQQDAKVGTLQQMFQDYDNEVLCSVLFEQCNGDLDKSIETILQMQKAHAPELSATAGTEAEDQSKDMQSSLAEGADGDETTGTAASGQTTGTADATAVDNVDKETQELIDEMLAEDQQAILQAEQDVEEEQLRAHRAMAVEQQRMEQLLLENDLKVNRQASRDDEPSEGADLLNKFAGKFKQSLSGLQGMFNDDDEDKTDGKTNPDADQQRQSNATVPKQKRPKTWREMVDDEVGVVEEYTFQLPQYSCGESTLFSPRGGPESSQGSEAKSPVSTGDFNVNVDNDEAIDLEHPVGASGSSVQSTDSSTSQGRGVQVHSAKHLRKAGLDENEEGIQEDGLEGHVAVQEYDDDSGDDDEIPRFTRQVASQVEDAQRALSSTVSSLTGSFKGENAANVKQKAEDIKDQVKDGGARAAAKVKESSQAAAQKMKEAGSLMSDKLKSFF